MMGKIPGFWQYYVLPKITNVFEGIYTLFNDPYFDGPNEYIRRIERNLARLKQKLEAGE